MLTRKVVIHNPSGIHAVYAASLCQLVQDYESDVFIKSAEKTANGKSFFSILGLGIQMGDVVTILVDGMDEKETLEAVLGYLEGLAE
ncbi:HPr family phosphocarrier protein [Eubacterium barkeri]|uniref:Phosphocarrier protein n=1 Tax=Eubacterium barkeri TaxID=1528 RepID=A0A1H3G2X7_EUBBA|nr:HPr family phosphocarrier protein [Eubacterium barkeri]SDX97445.1 phosphocarrier protein [Eubacterium barkeri]